MAPLRFCVCRIGTAKPFKGEKRYLDVPEAIQWLNERCGGRFPKDRPLPVCRKVHRKLKDGPSTLAAIKKDLSIHTFGVLGDAQQPVSV